MASRGGYGGARSGASDAGSVSSSRRGGTRFAPQAAAELSNAELKGLAAEVAQAAAERYENPAELFKGAGSGAISRAETRKFFVEFGFDQGIADRFFDRFDMDGEGAIPIQALEMLVTPEGGAEPQPGLSEVDMAEIAEELAIRAAGKYGPSAMRKIFVPLAEAAGNNSTFVRRDHVRSFFGGLGLPPVMADDFFDTIDCDAAGRIDYRDITDFVGPFVERQAGGDSIAQAPTSAPPSSPPATQGQPNPLTLEQELEFQKITEAIGKASQLKHSGDVRHVFRCVHPGRNGLVHRNAVRIFYRNYGYTEEVADRLFDYLDPESTGAIPYKRFKGIFEPYITRYEGGISAFPSGVAVPPVVAPAVPRTSARPPSAAGGGGKAVLDEDLTKITRQIGEAVSKKYNTVAEAFRSLHIDARGNISRGEVRNFFRHYGYPNQKEADRFFDQLDGNRGSTTINAADFQSHFALYIQPGHVTCRHLNKQQWIKNDGFDGQTTYSNSFGDAVLQQKLTFMTKKH